MGDHRSRFSGEEADQIRQLLKEVRRAEPASAKSLRGKLRREFGFHITDYSTDGQGITASDFDDQIRLGIIKVAD